MKKVIHTSDSRGSANLGWLKARHTFSFSKYYDESRVHFGMLRVLNDDLIAPSMGFGTHPHENMEIITIPLAGQIEHKDSTGRHEIIRKNDVQIMSAGRGISHSEVNPSRSEELNLLQIWVFPKLKNIEPKYQQKTFDPVDRENQLLTVVSPEEDSNAVTINQDAWFSLGRFDMGKEVTYQSKLTGNGTYIFVIEGKIEVDGEILERRDAVGISEFDEVNIKVLSDSEFLIMDVPMN